MYYFGPISQLELELKDLLIFIGEQASGKSTVSKAIFFFRSLRDELVRYIYQCYEEDRFDPLPTVFEGHLIRRFSNVFGPAIDSPQMQIEYQYDNQMTIRIRPSIRGYHVDIMFDDFLCKSSLL